MKLYDSVDVYLDDHPSSARRIGILRPAFQGERTLASSSFEYTPEYLRSPGRYELSPDLPLIAGKQYAREDQALFGAFADLAPDDWGSSLIDDAYSKERTSDQPLSIGTFDHLVQLNDLTRMGALRFRAAVDPAADEDTREWLTQGVHTGARVSDAGRLAAAAARFEVYEATDEDMDLLGIAGSSLGGARPKATVHREDGSLWVLKLPSNRDRRADIEAWEAVALEIASRAGLSVPRFELVPIEGYNSSLLVERFDREGETRVGYISAMTAMGISPQQASRRSYEDLADTVDTLVGEHGGSSARHDLQELFGRVALNVLIGNTDDHWKNHGFIRTTDADGRGWRLSPLFDVNPSRPTARLRGRSLSATDGAGERDIRLLIEGADAYALTADEAASVLAAVVSAVEGWREIAASMSIAPAEIAHMAAAFSATQLDYATSFIAQRRHD